jgi:hypothetical protein
MELPVSSNDVSVTGLQLSVALSNTDVGEVAATLGIRGCNCRYHVREKPRGHILLYFSQKKKCFTFVISAGAFHQPNETTVREYISNNLKGYLLLCFTVFSQFVQLHILFFSGYFV